jgi:phosphoribosylglycinamide formyltransferase-1
VDRQCGAINVANSFGIPSILVERKTLKDTFFTALDQHINVNTDLIVLAGFFPIIPDWMCVKWNKKIINTHPSLLPKYGGKGMYGVKVQEAVMANNEHFAGCTVHYVDAGIDTGEIISQKQVEVDYNDSPWMLGKKIFEEEIKLLPLTVGKIRNERRAIDT